MYNLIFPLLHTLQCAYHQKFSFHLSPYSWSPLSILPSLCPLPSGNHSVLCIYMFVLFSSFIVFLFVCFLYSTYEWNHIVFVFLWLISLGIYPQGPSMLSQMARLHLFILWLSNIPLYIYMLCHIFFIHSSTDGHLSYFYNLATVK